MEEIYKQNARIVYHYLYSKCRDEHIAEELTQETFLQAFKSYESYDGSCKLSTWLCQIAKHLLYRTWEKRKREIPVEWEEEGFPESHCKRDVEQDVLVRLELKEVLKDMQELPSAMREVIYLRAISDLSYKEIGTILGKSENWARVNFYRGKELLIQKRRKQDEGV